MGAHRIQTVTADGRHIGRWSVSYHDWPKGKLMEKLPPGHYELNVSRSPASWRESVRYGDHNGKVFSSMEEANSFALERGYLQRYYRWEYAMARRLHRTYLKKKHRQIIAWIKRATTIRAISNGIEWVASMVARELGNPLAKCHWEVGWYAAARNLRPELYAGG